MEANFPARPLIGLLLRLLYQHYSQDIHAALREAGFGDIRAAHANVFPFVPPEGSPSRSSPSSPGCASRRWPRRSSSSRAWATSSAARTRTTAARGWSSSPSAAQAVKPVTHATAARVEEHWAELTSPEELEALRASLLHLLTELRAE